MVSHLPPKRNRIAGRQSERQDSQTSGHRDIGTSGQRRFGMDPQGPVTIRTTQFITNRLLNRRQFIVTIFHPTRANISRSELGEKLAGLYKTEAARVSVFGLKTKFGGGVSTGFGLIYDDEESQKKFEPKHRLVRSGLADKVVKASRKLRKERKNRSKKVRGKAKTKAGEPAKKK
ncbi:40S ribosomal eS24 domain-containing protein [Kwoniella dejecticola CBS 10117]|uniref:40S ribosomal protein S24 n=1 Tax=Kwoniella dejecticola CBS 10117 TaxID=1296121 RepID=A0A1A6A2D8_9TREE|nr:30S small subunit ribosomal protein S24e [Kwoniella dejecticola CBS 10117]OBR84227.1 30S small subunit ribosomal protein S24e [Kwoniella dejecticola CBS 10117]